MATTIIKHDPTNIDRARLVDDLRNSLAAVKRYTTPQVLKAIAADLLDRARDLDDERFLSWDQGDHADTDGDEHLDVAPERDAEEHLDVAPERDAEDELRRRGWKLRRRWKR